MRKEPAGVWHPRYDCEAYESTVVPRLLPVASELRRLAAPREGDKVLEVGAGTGLLTRLLTMSGCDLIASDADASMLRKASTCLTVHDGCDPALVVASVADLPFASGAFDLVVGNLTPLQESDQAVQEARRVLRRDGRMALSTWGSYYSEAELIKGARRAAGVKGIAYEGPAGAIERLQRVGFEVTRSDQRFAVEHDSVAEYLRFRNAFGAPRDLSATEAIAYRGAIGRASITSS